MEKETSKQSCHPGEDGRPFDWLQNPGDLPPLAPGDDPAKARERYREELAAPVVSRWGNLFTIDDIFAPRPPRRYAAGLLFELPSLNIVYGSPGALKTFLLMDLAISIVAGHPWLPPPDGGDGGMATTHGAAIWLDEDEGRPRTLERLEALCRAHGVLPGGDSPIYGLSMPGFNAGSPDDIAALTRDAKERGAVFIGIDNLGTVKGNVDENSGAMIQVLAGLRRLSEDTGAAVVVVHHQSKAAKMPGQRLGNSLRGHSSIEASLDCALLIEREGQAESCNVQVTKARGVGAPPFRAAFTYDPPEPGAALSEARFFGVPLDYSQSAYALDLAILEIVQEKTNERLNQTALVACVREAHPNTWQGKIKERLAALEKNGKLAVTKGKNNSKVYEAAI